MVVACEHQLLNAEDGLSHELPMEQPTAAAFCRGHRCVRSAALITVVVLAVTAAARLSVPEGGGEAHADVSAKIQETHFLPNVWQWFVPGAKAAVKQKVEGHAANIAPPVALVNATQMTCTASCPGTCCGELCCAAKAKCCTNDYKEHTCAAPASVCGGVDGGLPLTNGTAGVFDRNRRREMYRKWILERCMGAETHTYCPYGAVCCNGKCAAKGSVCCGSIVCGENSTCCKGDHGAHVCGGPGALCFHGTPLLKGSVNASHIKSMSPNANKAS